MTASASDARGMPVTGALQVLIELRAANQLVVTNQASARVWPQLAVHALDFHYNPSTMGGAVPLGLGLALAQPQREVLVVSGDGSLLMSLGSLVTVVGAGARNLTIVVLENRMYEVTGGQQTPAATAPVSFAGLAQAAGFPVAVHFHDLDPWQQHAPKVLASAGPRLICLEVQPTPAALLRGPTPPLADQLSRLRLALIAKSQSAGG